MLAVALSVVFVSRAHAADKTWDGSTGNWSDGTKWSPAGAPTMNGTDNAEVGSGTVTYDPGGDFNITAGSKLTVKGTGVFSRTAGGALNMNNSEIAVEGGSFTNTTHFRMGNSQPGTWTHSGGTADLASMWVGDGGGAAGSSVSISNTAILDVDNFVVGTRGSSSVVQTDGDVTGLTLLMGHSANRNNTMSYALSGGTVDVNSLQFEARNGTMTISGTGALTTDALTFFEEATTNSSITMQDDGVLNILESHKNQAAVEALFGTRILGTNLRANVVDIGGTNYVQASVPEPSTFALAALGLLGLLAWGRGKRFRM